MSRAKEFKQWVFDINLDGVNGVANHAVEIIEELEAWIADLQSGMYINCVYCGHRYGPNSDVGTGTIAQALTKHIEQCPAHPLSEAKEYITDLTIKVQFLVDNWPVPLEDECMSFHDGDCWEQTKVEKIDGLADPN